MDKEIANKPDLVVLPEGVLSYRGYGPDKKRIVVQKCGDGLLKLFQAYAKEHAAPRIEITGKLDNPAVTPMSLPPMFIKSHGVWALLSTYDWDLGLEDIDFKAITLPTASLTVASEEITSY